MIVNPIVVDMDVGADTTTVPMTIETDVPIVGMSMSAAYSVQIKPSAQYQGDYVITPSAETQILETQNLLCADNITINPIPSNYGLVTWNGSTLTVS